MNENKFKEMLAKMSKIFKCKPLTVSQDQYEAVESLVLVYMLAASEDKPHNYIKSLDEQFNRIFKVVEAE